MIKIVVIAIVCGVTIIYLKNINSELTVPATIASGIIILSLSIDYVSETFSVISELINISGLSSEIYVIMFKVVGIGYIVEFGAGTLEDFGLKSLADKLSFVGKFVMISVSAPLIYAVVNILKGFLS